MKQAQKFIYVGIVVSGCVTCVTKKNLMLTGVENVSSRNQAEY